MYDTMHQELATEGDGGSARRCFAVIHQPCYKLIPLKALWVRLEE